MLTKLTRLTILVKDQDEALRWYTRTLGFEKRADQVFGPGMRWLTVAPKDQEEVEIVLVSADTPEKQARIGSQAADHVFLVVQTDNCGQEYERLQSRGVKFLSPPAEQPWGVEAVFEDLYGNRMDLLEFRGT
ncbi:MAG: VOC family protein [Anaerolineae bacterium]|jgi:catechol 2,3-dioxygenase-like lactoylglutathione lyase family enzyme